VTKRTTGLSPFLYKKAAKVTKRTTGLSPTLYKKAAKVTKRPTTVTFDYKKAAKVTPFWLPKPLARYKTRHFIDGNATPFFAYYYRVVLLFSPVSLESIKSLRYYRIGPPKHHFLTPLDARSLSHDTKPGILSIETRRRFLLIINELFCCFRLLHLSR